MEITKEMQEIIDSIPNRQLLRIDEVASFFQITFFNLTKEILAIFFPMVFLINLAVQKEKNSVLGN